MITKFFESQRKKRALNKLKAAFATVESAGYSVCNIQQRGGTNYLVDGSGNWHKVGKRALANYPSPELTYPCQPSKNWLAFVVSCLSVFVAPTQTKIEPGSAYGSALPALSPARFHSLSSSFLVIRSFTGSFLHCLMSVLNIGSQTACAKATRAG